MGRDPKRGPLSSRLTSETLRSTIPGKWEIWGEPSLMIVPASASSLFTVATKEDNGGWWTFWPPSARHPVILLRNHSG
jgi:hypothetical protein